METITALFSPYEKYLPWLGSASALMFLLSLAIVPTLLARIPVNHFKQPANPTPKISGIHYPLVWILTIVIGIFIADFPGKQALERKLVANRKVFNAINWIRAKKGVASLTYPE